MVSIEENAEFPFLLLWKTTELENAKEKSFTECESERGAEIRSV